MTESPVGGHECQAAFNGLAHEHAVGRGPVQEWEARQMKDVLFVERNAPEAVPFASPREQDLGLLRPWQPAQLVL